MLRAKMPAPSVVLTVFLLLLVAVPSLAGQTVFSTSPIDPEAPSNLTTSFRAGDYIYAVMQPEGTWRELLKAQGKSELGLLVTFEVEDQSEYQYVTLKSPALIDSSQLVLDIAPEPANMTAYRDPGITWGEGKGNRKVGPIAFTWALGQLGPGTHTVRVFVRDFGNQYALGEFTIEGQDFSFYADLHEKVKQAERASAGLPEAKRTDPALEAKLLEVLAAEGWRNILRIVIVDQDWWLDRVSGGDSPIKSRHIAAALAGRSGDGICYYRVVTFHQPRLIDGSWGALEVTNRGRKLMIPCDNVGP